MKQDFTLNDIADFIKENLNLVWYGEIYDEDAGQYRRAQLNDFEELRYLSFKVGNLNHASNKTLNYPHSLLSDYVRVMVLNDTFKIAPLKDYSKQWLDFKTNRKEITIL